MVITKEPKAQPEAGEPAEEGRKEKTQRSVRHNEEGELEGNKDFVFVEAHGLRNKLFSYKGFISERGFGKHISPFSKIIEKKGWDFFCKHKAPGFTALARKFYSNMAKMKDSLYVHEVFQLKELKMVRNSRNWLKTQTTRKL